MIIRQPILYRKIEKYQIRIGLELSQYNLKKHLTAKGHDGTKINVLLRVIEGSKDYNLSLFFKKGWAAYVNNVSCQ